MKVLSKKTGKEVNFLINVMKKDNKKYWVDGKYYTSNMFDKLFKVVNE